MPVMWCHRKVNRLLWFVFEVKLNDKNINMNIPCFFEFTEADCHLDDNEKNTPTTDS